jgi:uncharacterized protein (TIGR03067 family)
MRGLFTARLAIGLLLMAIAAQASADEALDAAIRKDREQIEGIWRIVALEVEGNKAQEDDARKLSVLNGADGTWRLLSDGQEVCRGTSSFDPTKKTKTIDFAVTAGEASGTQYVGIYELGDQTRRLCFGPAGRVRPTEFATAPGGETILVHFERDKDDAIRKDRLRIAGTWLVTSLNLDGQLARDEDARKLQVVNGTDGTWKLLSEGQEVARGISTFDPTRKLKTIDFTITEGGGQGNRHLGIYELGETTRRLCFAAPGRERPTDFSSKPGSEQILVTFERVKSK